MAAKLLIMFALVAVLMCGNVEARAASATVNCTELEPLINALVSYKVYQVSGVHSITLQYILFCYYIFFIDASFLFYSLTSTTIYHH